MDLPPGLPRSWPTELPVPDDVRPVEARLQEAPSDARAVTAGDAGYVAVGQDTFGGNGGRSTVWASTDGRTWDVLHPEPMSSSHLSDVEWTGSAFVAVGSARTGKVTPRPRAFWSEDGTAWTQAHFAGDGLGAEMYLQDLWLVGDQLIGLGGQEGHGTFVWTSDDGGRSWGAHEVTALQDHSQGGTVTGCVVVADPESGDVLLLRGSGYVYSQAGEGTSRALVDYGLPSCPWAHHEDWYADGPAGIVRIEQKGGVSLWPGQE